MPVCIGGNSPVRRKVLATPFALPEESVLEDHGLCTHPGVNHTEPAVEDAAAEAPNPDEMPPLRALRRAPSPPRPSPSLRVGIYCPSDASATTRPLTDCGRMCVPN